MTSPLELLWPRPQRARRTGDGCHLSAAPSISLEPPTPEGEQVRQRLAEDLVSLGLGPQVEAGDGPGRGTARDIVLTLGEEAPDRPEAYHLLVGAGGIRIAGRDVAGLRHGAATLAQWLRLVEWDEPSGEIPSRLPGLEIEDWPDLAVRGVMLDISRDRVPTFATLLEVVDLLASFKVNQLQLYMEHTFAYRGHEEVWREASPLTAEEVVALDALCRARGVELVPNQNSFGHFHRWLSHPRYRPLAEVPEGREHPFSPVPEPYGLCPTDPGSLALLADLYDQLLPCFGSRLFNVGLDETLDLGLGRSRGACDRLGKERVYLDFLLGVHELARERGHRIQFWGDIVVEHPEIVSEVPSDAIALEWGYEADHPFRDHARVFREAGLELVLCPGTSSWNSFAGRTTNALRNASGAARAARDEGARGLLVCDWGDHGHLQPFPAAWPGLVAGAGFAWNPESAAEPLEAPIARILDRHVFRDRRETLGEVTCGLGDVYRLTGADTFNGTTLFFLVVFAHQDLEDERYRGLTIPALEAARERIEEQSRRLSAASLQSPGIDRVRRELTWVAGLLRFACDLGLERLAAGPKVPMEGLPATARRRLVTTLDPLIEEHGPLWLARSRPGGRRSSVARLERARALLEE